MKSSCIFRYFARPFTAACLLLLPLLALPILTGSGQAAEQTAASETAKTSTTEAAKASKAASAKAAKSETAKASKASKASKPSKSSKSEAKPATTPKKAAASGNVYENQPPVTDKELMSFLDLLPRFRAWAKENKVEARPLMRNGKADFSYTPQAAEWVRTQNWDPVRFFCVMGRMAAALVIVAEGNDMSGTLPADMPRVTEAELGLARKHLGEMLKAGGDAPPINR